MTTAGTYRKKPIEIQAIQWTGGNYAEAIEFLGDSYAGAARGPGYDVIDIDTLEGPITASLNDWIIRGIKGEHYPCKPDIFEATYEPVPPFSLVVCTGTNAAGGHVAHAAPCPLHPEATS